MAGYWDRDRSARLMRQAGLDAVLLVQPESIGYATGAHPGVATLWRRAGAAFVLVPADPAAPLAAVVGDLQAASFQQVSGIADVRTHAIWVESISPALGPLSSGLAAAHAARGLDFQRPATFDARQALGLVRDILAERGLAQARIGLELGFVPVADMALFRDALPDVRWGDASPIVARMRMIKSAAEIAILRDAAELTACGLGILLEALRPGLDAGDMEAIWRGAVQDEALRRGIALPVSGWAYIAVGPDGFAKGGAARAGDVVKVDVGAVIGGYSADMARTAVIGRPNADQGAIHAALLCALEAALEALRPGRPLREAHQAATRAMVRAGFAGFSRGHFGHGLGASIFSEEWPFIAADCEETVEPGMVLAVEAPWYVKGLGGFIIEDQVLVTEDGLEPLAALPRSLHATSA
jgi:Xaa-Pro dipeptidase